MGKIKRNTDMESRHFYLFDTTEELLRKSKGFFKKYLEEENVNLLCDFSKNNCWKNCKRCKENLKY